MKKKLFQEYALIESQIRDLEAKREKIKESCLEEMRNEDAFQVKSDWGTFSITERKYYSYTEKVKTAESKIKEMKKKEEESGAATVEVKQSLMYRPIKVEK